MIHDAGTEPAVVRAPIFERIASALPVTVRVVPCRLVAVRVRT